ncbi:hypothetical protein GA0074696_1647 [Micromonospora purpureochromogenes]|uniref:Uncharacterized protein n=2 Tax=Micromonospora purpureochromogenes TaxID=47872 RepID=A0A1C4W735_9ACTN|nr:hypothetical protein GA0074696_1647 [Micromonospora purpureochromogenes]
MATTRTVPETARGGDRPAASLADMFTHALIDVAAAPAVRGLLLVARPRVRRPALAGRDAHRRA